MASAAKKRGHKVQTEKGNNRQSQIQGKSGKIKRQQTPERTFIERMDDFMAPRLHIVLYVSLFFSVFFGAFLFDVKISTGGDDSSYIEMAQNYINGISFPTFHGPLYSVFLSLPILLFGVNVVMLKLISFAFIIGHLVFFFYTFRKHFSPAIFSLIMLIISVGSTILYFASQTYSEAMYMFLQALVVYFFLNTFLTLSSEEYLSLQNRIKKWLIIGFFAFIISLTRDIGIVMLISMVLFLIIQRKYLDGLLVSLAYFTFFIPYQIYKSVVWNSVSSSRTSNFSEILLKNHYNRAEGYEDFSGMVVRFFENARLYLSKHFLIGIGLHDPASTDKSWFVTLIIIGLLLIALFYAARRNRIMLFISIYLGASLAATFIALQTSWDQMRMVVIYIPMMLILLSWGILQLAAKKGYGFLQVVLVGFLVLIFFKTIGQTMDKMKANREVLAQNIRGNMYYGFTPDWQNYLRMSEWIGENLPEGTIVASRKPSMSFIYSKGRDFYGIYRMPTKPTRDLISEIRNKNENEIIAISNAGLQSESLELQMYIKINAAAFVAEGDNLFGIYSVDEQFEDLLQRRTGQPGFSVMNIDSLMNRLDESNLSPYAVSPDTLVNELRQNNVDYVIMANLRAVPAENTGRTINTVQRFLYFIQQKYPGIFTLEHQIGVNNEEPAWLYRINYDMYRL